MKFLSAEHEPLRRYVYGIVGSALALVLVLGLVTAEQAAAIGALGAAVLLVPAVELARTKVDSPATVKAKVAEAKVEAVAEAEADAEAGNDWPVEDDSYVGRHAALQE